MAQATRLTERQKGCLRLVAQGYTSKEIGRYLGISPATVDNHIRLSLEVLQVESRAEAARLLTAAEANQPLTSQAQTLAEPRIPMAIEVPTDRPSRWWHWLVPPLGGQRNELSSEAKIFAILRVAVLGFFGVATLTIGVVVLFWLLR